LRNYETVAIGFNEVKHTYAFSILDDFEPKKKNIKKFMEEQLTIELAKIVRKI